jgi:hypothetical protein
MELRKRCRFIFGISSARRTLQKRLLSEAEFGRPFPPFVPSFPISFTSSLSHTGPDPAWTLLDKNVSKSCFPTKKLKGPFDNLSIRRTRLDHLDLPFPLTLPPRLRTDNEGLG